MRRHGRPMALAVIGVSLALIGPSTALGQWKSDRFFSYLAGSSDTTFEGEASLATANSLMVRSVMFSSGYPDAPGVDTAGVGTSYMVTAVTAKVIVRKWMNGQATAITDTVNSGTTEARRLRSIDSVRVVNSSGSTTIVRVRIDGHKYIFK